MTNPRSRWLALYVLCTGMLMIVLDVTIVNVALPSIQSDLDFSPAGLAWVVNAYLIAFGGLLLLAGRVGDLLGQRRIFVTGLVVFTAASVACGLAPDAWSLIAARAVQGLGAAILVPNSLALLSHAYGDHKSRGRAVGIWAAGASLALTAGPLVGGGLIALVGWRSIFLVNLPIGVLGLGLTWRYASETAPASQREIDLPGQLAAMAALGCLACALIEGGAAGWSSTLVIAGFIASASLAMLFIARELHAAQPMLPLSLFRHRRFALTSLVGLLVNVAFYGLIFVFSLYFQRLNGLSPFATGLAFLPMMAAVLPVNLVAARLAERIGAPATIAAGAAAAALGCLALLGIRQGTSYAAIFAQLVVIGAGLGLLVPSLTSTLLGSVEKSRSGLAAGVLNSTRQTGSVLGVALFGSLVGQSDAFVAGAHVALIISAGLLMAAAAAILSARLFDGRP